MIRYRCSILRAAHSGFICTTNVTLEPFLFQEKGSNLARDSLIIVWGFLMMPSILKLLVLYYFLQEIIRASLGRVISAQTAPILHNSQTKTKMNQKPDEISYLLPFLYFTNFDIYESIRKISSKWPLSLVKWFDESLQMFLP